MCVVCCPSSGFVVGLGKNGHWWQTDAVRTDLEERIFDRQSQTCEISRRPPSKDTSSLVALGGCFHHTKPQSQQTVSSNLHPQSNQPFMNPQQAITVDDDCEMKVDDPFDGNVVLVYKHGGCFVTGRDARVLKLLLGDPVISRARIPYEPPIPTLQALNPDGEPAEDDDDDDDDIIPSFAILQAAVPAVRARALELGYPLAEEYDFKSDATTPNLPRMYRKPHAHIRTYQAQALSAMLGSGRARSGMIVLPCGAGKTLTGVTAAHTIQKSVLCLTTNAVSVQQWKEQFHHWTTIPDSHVAVFTADHKETNLPDDGILISTYQMIAFSGQRAAESRAIMDLILSRTWGLLLMDEAHVVPANEYRRAIQCIRARCKLGLTATMVREDDRIRDLHTLVGPTLYRANWMDLTEQGYLANVKCLEVWCPMTKPFLDAHRSEPNARRKLLLCGVNPRKLRAVEFLVRYHERRGDKIIVFSDSIFTLQVCAEMLKRPYIYGQTKEWERQLCLEAFRKDTLEVQTICLSKVGDVAIDLPKANVVIQVTCHFGARRQEAQRLGRILRPKTTTGNNTGARAGGRSFDAFFYTLVSTDTQEMEFSGKRQQFLVDQGYSYEVVENLCDQADSLAATEGCFYATPEHDLDLLKAALDEMKN